MDFPMSQPITRPFGSPSTAPGLQALAQTLPQRIWPILFTVGYTALAVGWLLLSDQLADLFFHDGLSQGALMTVGTLLLIAVSAAGLYRLIAYYNGAAGLQAHQVAQSNQTRDDIIEALPDAFFMLGPDGRVSSVNAASE